MQGSKHQPTPETRAQVESLASFGIIQDKIATYLGICKKTLLKHYREELDKGEIDKTLEVANALFHQATVEGSVPAQIFFLKARAGWSEKPKEEEKEDSEPQKVVIEIKDARKHDREP